MSQCWFMRQQSQCMIVGGKFGDCVQLTAAFHEIWQRTGHRVNVVCSSDYAPVFDGCSFVNVMGVPVPWDTGLPKMKQVADAQFGGGVCLQFWHDTTSSEFKNTRGGIALQIHGKHFRVDTAIDQHYSASMFRRAGFNWQEALSLRPVFDQRDSTRESALLNRCWPERLRNKPMLLVAFEGQSSPWGYLPETHRVIGPVLKHFHVIDLGKLKAIRVYDMLALMENSVGLITVDTLALHLVAATDLPYCCFVNDGWLGSVGKGNCVLSIRYSQSLKRLHEVVSMLEKWRNERPIIGRTPVTNTTLKDQCYAIPRRL